MVVDSNEGRTVAGGMQGGGSMVAGTHEGVHDGRRHRGGAWEFGGIRAKEAWEFGGKGR